MRIYTCEEPELRVVCDPVDILDEKHMEEIAHIAEAAANLMYATNGCGIAAPQVGLRERFIVVDTQWNPETGDNKLPVLMINPEIISSSAETEMGFEGCLSVPGVTVAVERSQEVSARYIDANGQQVEVAASGFLARCLQHEIDHLNGITLLDKLSGVKKLSGLAHYNAARQQNIQPGDPAVYIVK